MQKLQRFLVSWSDRDGDWQVHAYHSLEAATFRYVQIKTRDSVEYVFLSVVIDLD